VVVISTASGLKFPDFKVGYHEGALGRIADTYANHPVVLPAEYEAVKRAALDGVDAASR
jgi:threonine synthase